MVSFNGLTERTRGYVVALGASGVALLLRLTMLWLLGDRAPFFPFILAVLVSAWFGGLRPGLLATLLGSSLGSLFYSDPLQSTTSIGLGGAITVVLFVVIAVSVSFACEALHAARRRVEEKQCELQIAETALKEADRRKDEFLAILAHELRNPLAPLSNCIEIMRLVEHDQKKMHDVRDLMERQVKHMVRLVDDLLDVNRISTGKLHLRKSRVDLADAIQTAVEFVRPLIDKLSHELLVTLPADRIELDGDSIRLAQIFSNLLNNAAKYTERGGQIRLTAERAGDFAMVSVKDSGIGIAAEDLPRIFERFSQVASALDRSHGGLGIGLSLVHGLVELHGGSVQAKSPGRGLGSEFIVRLPVLPVAARVSTPFEDRVSPRESGSQYRILVVDDNQDAANSLGMMLRWQGYLVEVVHGGLEALRAAESFLPRVVLLDIGMPHMNGYEVARELRTQSWSQGMTLIALTGWGHEEDKRKAMDAGFDHHLTKPADLTVLRKCLERLAPIPVANG